MCQRNIAIRHTFETSTDKEDVMSVLGFLSSTFTLSFSKELPLSSFNVSDGFFGECCAVRFWRVFFKSVLTCSFDPATEFTQSMNHIAGMRVKHLQC